MNQTNFSFKVLSIGSFFQDLVDGITILNRPCIFINEEKKRYGNEYILFNKDQKQLLESGREIFLGFFGIDKKKKRKYIRLYKNLKIPVKVPDYYMVTMKHAGKLDKDFDFIKTDPTSFSQIFSSAFYHKEDDTFECETTFVVKNGDVIHFSDATYMFSAKDEKFVKM